MSFKTFRAALKRRQEKIRSLVCVGLDPILEKLPDVFPHQTTGYVTTWMKTIVDATAPYACMFKPQSAYWEAIPDGIKALRDVVDYIKWKHPGIPVFLDCKRGDIDRTQNRYRDVAFKIIGAHGMNFNPYMGKTCMASLIEPEYPELALVGLCYTSNPDAREIQDLLMSDGRRLWQVIAEETLAWSEELNITNNAGLVMAAAYELPPKGSGHIYSEHLSDCRKIVGDKLWFLIPGIGTQGGFIEETVRSSFVGYGSIAINSSSDIIFASSGNDFADAAAQKAKTLRDKINEALHKYFPVI